MIYLNIDEIRTAIPALSSCIYMNSGGIGPTPQIVLDEIMRLYSLQAGMGAGTPPVMKEVRGCAEQTRLRAADLLGVDPSEVAFVRNPGEGVNVVLWGLDLKPGDEIVTSAEEHVSVFGPCAQLAKTKGIKIRTLELAADKETLINNFERLLTPRTRLVCLSYVTCETGTKIPAKEICDIARGKDVPVLLDGAQATGQFPINLRELGCDFYVTSGHKWMMGPWGVGISYVRRDWLDKLEVSWTGSGVQSSLDWETYEITYLDSARRYEFGARHWPLYAALGKAIQFLRELGVHAIHARATSLANVAKQQLAMIPGVEVLTPMCQELSTGIVTIRVSGYEGEELSEKLWGRWRILVRPARPKGSVRICIGFFHTEAELGVLVDAIRHLASERI